MASAGVIDTILRQLATADLSAKDKLEAAVTLRDHLDHYTTGPVYPQFLKKVMPVIIGILNGPPSFQSASPEQVRLCFPPLLLCYIRYPPCAVCFADTPPFRYC